MAAASRVTLCGTVVSFNLSPKGVPEGLLVRREPAADASVVQVNFDPALAGQVLAIVDGRAAVAVEARPFADAKHDAPHAVYELVRVESADGRSVVADGPAEAEVRVRGTAVRLNHARRGEVNGAILDTGEFVHLRPHGATLAGLAVGQALDVVGEVRAGWSGRRVIEARTVNGLEIGKPPKPRDDKPPKHDHGPKHDPKHEHDPKHDDKHHDDDKPRPKKPHERDGHAERSRPAG